MTTAIQQQGNSKGWGHRALEFLSGRSIPVSVVTETTVRKGEDGTLSHFVKVTTDNGYGDRTAGWQQYTPDVGEEPSNEGWIRPLTAVDGTVGRIGKTRRVGE